MKQPIKTFIFIAALMMATLSLRAAVASDMCEVRVAPADGSWTMPVGKEGKFRILVTRDNIPVPEGTVDYDISEDLMTPRAKGTVKFTNGEAIVDAGTMDTPGFLRCNARCKIMGRDYSATGTIGFDPDSLRPVTNYPADFKDFWEKEIAKATAGDMNARMELIPEKCTPEVNVYRVSFKINANERNTYYGMLAMPAKEGSYPAIVQFPGAGVYAIDAPVDRAKQGIIAMAMGIHCMENDLDADVYNTLSSGALSDYPTRNMQSRDRYYYKNVILGAVRAVDFLAGLPQCNGRIATYGGSQGGFLSIAVAALHPSVCYVVANFPAMSDLAGYTRGRAGGWPHIFKSEENRTPELLETLSYFDTANFARHITVPGYYCFGYNDRTCAPTTTYAVYNTIAAPKTLLPAPLATHRLLSEQKAEEDKALATFLLGSND